MSKIAYVSILGLASAIAACSTSTSNSASSDDDLRGISSTEAEAELTAVGDAIKAYYGPLDFKGTRFGFNLTTAVAAAKTQIKAGKTEGDRVRPIYELLAQLHDSHVSYQYPLPASKSSEYDLPLLITPFQGTYLVDLVAKNPTIGRGDVLVSIDGQTPAQLAATLGPLTGEGNPDTETIMTASLFTFRPFYVPSSLIPTAPTAHVIVTHADGTTAAIDLPWKVTPGGLAGPVAASTAAPTTTTTAASGAAAKVTAPHVGAMFSGHAGYLRAKKQEIIAGLGEFSALQPWWLTTASTATLAGITPVSPKAATLAALGVTLPAPDAQGNPVAPAFLGLGAYKYQYEGKTILVVRIPGFEAPTSQDPNEDTYGENIAWLAALLQDNLGTAPAATTPATAAPADGTTPAPAPAPATDTPADVVVLDDTENPGGLATYALGIASMFATKPMPSLVQAMHADRKWLGEYNDEVTGLASYPDFANIVQGWMTSIESAYDSHHTLTTQFLPLSGDFIGPNAPQDTATILGATMLEPNANVQWSKPVLILHDNLSVSCADFFPALLQNAGIAKTFGARTMGGGGNVEPVLTQDFSGAILSLTRGMGGPFNPNGAPKLIENEGVTPDFAHPVTVADFRAGYTDYVAAFSHIAVNLPPRQ